MRIFEVLEKYKCNWILVLASTIAVVLALTLFLFEFELPVNKVNQFDRLPIVFLVVFVSLLAPVLEELSFRGFFTSSYKLKVVALLGFLTYSGFVLCFKYSVGLAVFVLSVMTVLIIFYYKFKSDFFFNFFVIANAVVFGLIHYQSDDFMNQPNPFILIQVTFALFLTWITINKGIFSSILLHGLWNSIALIILFVNIQLVSDKTQIVNNKEVRIIYKQVPIMDSNTVSVTNTEDGLIAKNVTIQTFLDLGITDNSLKSAYSSIIPMARYDITVEFKDDGRNYETVLKILQEKEMIVKN